MTDRRTAGAALLVYGITTFIANTLIAAPGGQYDPQGVMAFVDPGHSPLAFAAAYLGCLGAVAVLLFALGVRRELGPAGDLTWGLGVAGATTGVIGWFVSAGVAVAMTEGGSAVSEGVARPVVYTLTEIGNLLSWCAPALFVGLIALLVSRLRSVPRWMRVFTAVAGVCGILAPFFFTYFVFLLWTLVFGGTMLARRPVRGPEVQASIV
jgi:hypothetical protein